MFTLDRQLPITRTTYCPFNRLEVDRCQAAISQLKPTQSPHAGLCSSDGYDDCPLFLSKILRH